MVHLHETSDGVWLKLVNGQQYGMLLLEHRMVQVQTKCFEFSGRKLHDGQEVSDGFTVQSSLTANSIVCLCSGTGLV